MFETTNLCGYNNYKLTFVLQQITIDKFSQVLFLMITKDIHDLGVLLQMLPSYDQSNQNPTMKVT